MRIVIIVLVNSIGVYFSDSLKSYLIGLVVGVFGMTVSLIDKLIKEENENG